MAEELDIFQDTTQDQQDLINTALTDLAGGGYADFLGLEGLNEGKPPEVVQGEDGQMYRNNPELTSSGWVSNPDYSTPVYYFHQPLEVGDARGNYFTASDDYQTATQQGNYYTEEEIRNYWDSSYEDRSGMDVFRQQNPDMTFETYMDFIKENSALHQQGFTLADNPEMFSEITDKYNINTSFQGETGHLYGWNGSNYTKTYHSSKSFEGGDLIMGLAVAGLTAGAISPAVTSILGTGGAATGAISSAIGSAISQGITEGGINTDQLLIAGILGGIGGLADDLAAGIQEGGGAITNVIDNAIWDLSGTLGMSYEETLNILEGITKGVITGSDITGIVANAVAGYSEAQIASYMQDYFGDSIDVDNFFKPGQTEIPIEALTPFVGATIQTLIDSGISNEDIAQTIVDYFGEGGSLDFLLPEGVALPDFIKGVSDKFPDINFDIPPLPDIDINFPELPDVNLPEVDIDLPEVDIDLPEVDVDLPEVDVDLPEVDVDLPEVDVDLPDVDLPDVDLPDVDIDTPDIDTPDIDTPDIDTPDVDLPDVDLPSIDLPKFISPQKPSFDETQPELMRTSYTKQTVPGLLTGSSSIDATGELNKFIARQIQNRRMFT